MIFPQTILKEPRGRWHPLHNRYHCMFLFLEIEVFFLLSGPLEGCYWCMAVFSRRAVCGVKEGQIVR